MGAVSIQPVTYRGWSGFAVENGQLKLIAIHNIGPRILYLSYRAGGNVLFEDAESASKREGDVFRLYGGHRFWIAPENERTTAPDNDAVEVEVIGNGVSLVGTVGDLRKQVRIELDPEGARARIHHRVTNVGSTPTQLAAWALTMMRRGAKAIIPLPPREPWGPQHLLPSSAMALWSYTDLSAPCWKLTPKYFVLDQALVGSCGFGMQKLGVHFPNGWAAARIGDVIFHKRAELQAGEYPDLGSNIEVFADADFLELETLGPLVELAPNESCEHLEHWSLWHETSGDSSMIAHQWTP